MEDENHSLQSHMQLLEACDVIITGNGDTGRSKLRRAVDSLIELIGSTENYETLPDYILFVNTYTSLLDVCFTCSLPEESTHQSSVKAVGYSRLRENLTRLPFLRNSPITQSLLLLLFRFVLGAAHGKTAPIRTKGFDALAAVLSEERGVKTAVEIDIFDDLFSALERLNAEKHDSAKLAEICAYLVPYPALESRLQHLLTTPLGHETSISLAKHLTDLTPTSPPLHLTLWQHLLQTPDPDTRLATWRHIPPHALAAAVAATPLPTLLRGVHGSTVLRAVAGALGRLLSADPASLAVLLALPPPARPSFDPLPSGDMVYQPVISMLCDVLGAVWGSGEALRLQRVVKTNLHAIAEMASQALGADQPPQIMSDDETLLEGEEPVIQMPTIHQMILTAACAATPAVATEVRDISAAGLVEMAHSLPADAAAAALAAALTVAAATGDESTRTTVAATAPEIVGRLAGTASFDSLAALVMSPGGVVGSVSAYASALASAPLAIRFGLISCLLRAQSWTNKTCDAGDIGVLGSEVSEAVDYYADFPSGPGSREALCLVTTALPVLAPSAISPITKFGIVSLLARGSIPALTEVLDDDSGDESDAVLVAAASLGFKDVILAFCALHNLRNVSLDAWPFSAPPVLGLLTAPGTTVAQTLADTIFSLTTAPFAASVASAPAPAFAALAGVSLLCGTIGPLSVYAGDAPPQVPVPAAPLSMVCGTPGAGAGVGAGEGEGERSTNMSCDDVLGRLAGAAAFALINTVLPHSPAFAPAFADALQTLALRSVELSLAGGACGWLGNLGMSVSEGRVGECGDIVIHAVATAFSVLVEHRDTPLNLPQPLGLALRLFNAFANCYLNLITSNHDDLHILSSCTHKICCLCISLCASLSKSLPTNDQSPPPRTLLSAVATTLTRLAEAVREAAQGAETLPAAAAEQMVNYLHPGSLYHLRTDTLPATRGLAKGLGRAGSMSVKSFLGACSAVESSIDAIIATVYANLDGDFAVGEPSALSNEIRVAVRWSLQGMGGN